MKDENDHYTAEIIQLPAAAGGVGTKHPTPQGCGALPIETKAKPFDGRKSVMDRQTEFAPKPKEGRLAYSNGIQSISFVPVAFAAKDWSVTPRRIRALLAEGRLAGQMQPNGYWEVRYPYLYTFGTRGPSLKRQQRPKKRPRTTEGKAA